MRKNDEILGLPQIVVVDFPYPFLVTMDRRKHQRDVGGYITLKTDNYGFDYQWL